MHPFDTAPPGDRADLLCGLLDRRAIRPDRLRGHSIMKDSSPSYPCGDYTSDAPILLEGGLSHTLGRRSFARP